VQNLLGATSMTRRLGPALALTLLLAACKGPPINSPLTGQSLYLCCNIHYEKPKINDTLYQVGNLIPFGTRVQILEVRADSVVFQPEGHPAITLVYEWGKKAGVPFDQYLDRLFVHDDPRAQFAPKPSPRGKSSAKGKAAPTTSTATLKLIENAQVEQGMTRAEVLASLGPPPLHMTRTLDQNAWHYWHNRWSQYVVYFEGDRVARVGR